MSYPIHRLIRSVSLQANPSFLNILDTLNPDEIDDEYDESDDDPTNFSSEKTGFGCRSCRRWLISQYALDRHIARCFINKIEKINEIYANDQNNQVKHMELLKKQYQDDMELLKKQYQDDIELLKKESKDEVELLKKENKDEVELLKKEMKTQHQHELELLKKQHQDDMQLMKNRHLDEISELNDQNDAYIDFLQKNSKATDQKWLALYETMFNEMKAIVTKDGKDVKDINTVTNEK